MCWNEIVWEKNKHLGWFYFRKPIFKYSIKSNFKYFLHHCFGLVLFKPTSIHIIIERQLWKILKSSQALSKMRSWTNRNRGLHQWLIFYFHLLILNLQIIMMDIYSQVALGPIIDSFYILEVNPWTRTSISADIGTFAVPLSTYVLI